jgi:hypothetical protein
VVVAVFVRSDRDDRDVVDHRVPPMAQGNLRHRSCSKYRSARGCHPCLRYDLLPMSPGRTARFCLCSHGRVGTGPFPPLAKVNGPFRF